MVGVDCAEVETIGVTHDESFDKDLSRSVTGPCSRTGVASTESLARHVDRISDMDDFLTPLSIVDSPDTSNIRNSNVLRFVE